MNHRIRRLMFILLKLKWRLKLLIASDKELVKSNNISIIVVGRNDNYGGDFSLRLKTTFDWNLKQLPGAELIYVEWNKIADKESDCVWIEKRYPNSKCFTVSNNIHKDITDNPKMPVMEYFAKNIGMRKASKEWFLLINADCLIGNDIVKNISMLNKNYVYGSHYVSFKWDEKPITDDHLTNKRNYVVAFPAPNDIGSVVGNFVLTHRDNWMNATGYDETLKNVRSGVDTNGLNQLFHAGIKPMAVGHHYHLDHPESIVHGKNDTHGVNAFNNIPYKNNENWGFDKTPLKQISERIWELEKI